MLADLLSRNAHKSLVRVLGNSCRNILNFSKLCQTLPEALETSRRTIKHRFFSARNWAIFSYVMAIAVSVPLKVLKPCWESGSD